ncbi:GAF and ANTAR domain-containing protein [Streptomyces sp. Ru73]|uniref:GAF and ANTAR domain-containing protein n=1 Tax=Streptomyces sp. Ru73 TaxID=2080748 RepID=UPI0021565246|nr:GAF and ANTAR domain-containing protein [Streptomyces sp. Ru73]
MAVAPQERVLQAFGEAVGTLLDDFDLIDALHRLCARGVELLDVTAVGIMLADPYGDLQVLAVSDERTRLLELFALQGDDGPCADAHRSAEPRVNVDLATAVPRPAFAARARKAGYTTAHALPLRLRRRSIGAVGLLHVGPHTLGPAEVRLGQTLADVATIAVLQQHTVERGNVERAQVQAALVSRTVIEQAKGVLAEHWTTGVDEAFDVLRGYARTHDERLADLARKVIDGTLDPAALRPAV